MPRTIFDDLLPIAIYGGLGYLLVRPGANGKSILDTLTQTIGHGISAGIQIPGVTGSSAATPSSPGSPSDPSQGTANSAAGNAFAIQNVTAFRHFDGNWYVDGDIRHIGGGGGFIGQLDMREAGLFGIGAGQYQLAGSFNFDVPQDANWTTQHISSGDQGIGGPPTFLGTDILLTIKGQSGEEYTHRQIAAQQGGA